MQSVFCCYNLDKHNFILFIIIIIIIICFNLNDFLDCVSLLNMDFHKHIWSTYWIKQSYFDSQLCFTITICM